MNAVEVGAGLALLCRVRNSLCALPLPHVVETMRPLPAQPLQGGPPFVTGLSIIRGVPVPVVDAGTLLGDSPDGEPSRYVTVKTGDRRVALAVDEVVGILDLSSLSLQPLPPLLERVQPGVAVLIGMLDAKLLVVLRDARMVPDSVWRSLTEDGESPCPSG